MKKTVLPLFIGLLLSILTFAQDDDYVPLAQEGAWWYVVSYTGSSSDFYSMHYNYFYEIEGNASFNGYDYKKLYRKYFYQQSNGLNTYSKYLEGFMREENKVVYFQDDEFEFEEVILYDFNLEVGDSIYPLSQQHYLFEACQQQFENCICYIFNYTNENCSDELQCIDYESSVEIDTLFFLQEDIGAFKVTDTYNTELLNNETVKTYNEETCFNFSFAE